jgi:hypothetical protein
LGCEIATLSAHLAAGNSGNGVTSGTKWQKDPLSVTVFTGPLSCYNGYEDTGGADKREQFVLR